MNWDPETGEPTPDTILGQVFSEAVNLGSNLALDTKIQPYSDEVYYLTEAYIFLSTRNQSSCQSFLTYSIHSTASLGTGWLVQ